MTEPTIPGEAAPQWTPLPGAEGHYGQPVDMSAIYAAPRTGDEIVYAGFWRRFWARSLTNLLGYFLSVVVFWGIAAATVFAYDGTATCTITSDNRRFCQGEDLVLYVGASILLIALWAITYYLYSRRVARLGATIGHQQLGLRVVGSETGLPPSKRRALTRTIAATSPQLVATGLAFLVILDAARWAWLVLAAAVIVTSVATLLGGLAMLADSKRRTMWDHAAKTVVVVHEDPSWFSVVAVVFGAVAAWAVLAFATTVQWDDLTDEYNRLLDGHFDSALFWTNLVPLAALAILAIVFGHLGIRETRWEKGRLAGRGAAVTGTVLGYTFPAMILLLIAVTFTTDRVESLNDQGCASVRRDIRVGLESYKRLNGTYPTSLGAIGNAEYLGEPPVPENWRYEAPADTPTGYVLEGRGECRRI